jgi:hypothetical protein
MYFGWLEARQVKVDNVDVAREESTLGKRSFL